MNASVAVQVVERVRERNDSRYERFDISPDYDIDTWALRYSF